MPAARRIMLATAVTTVAALWGAGSAFAVTVLQPGAISRTDTGQCTLNFAYGDDAGNTYLGSAAHCVKGVGDQVSDADGTVFGDVTLVGDAANTADDYSFIKVRPEALARVSPQVKGSPEYPTGVTSPEQTRLGSVQVSGFGLGFQGLRLTQEKRIGVFLGDDPSTYRVLAPILFGDSGGPVVYAPTGGALGIVSRLCLGQGLCTEEGPTVQGILAKAAARGVRLHLLT